MRIRNGRLALFAAGAVALSALATPAQAGTGCNGVVNWFVWGCAGWDNNNGPNFPYYKKRQMSVPIPKSGIKVQVKDGAALAEINGQKYPIVNGTAGLVASGGGNLVASGGGNLVASGGGNLSVWSQN